MLRALSKAVLIFLLLCLVAGSLFAEQTVFEEYPSALGVGVGFLSGVGVSYQQWFAGWGYQVAGGVIYHPLQLKYGFDPLLTNAGLELQFPIYTDSFNTWLSGRLYFFGGVRFRAYYEAQETSAGSGVYAASPFTLELGTGGGVGAELVLFDHFAAVAEMVYALVWTPLGSEQRDVFMMETYPQLSLRYRFR